ncbi:MAG: FAD synthase [Archaeoglobi archaeon]|nr:FAD synthase [Candidatus Mnemosynella sp.]
MRKVLATGTFDILHPGHLYFLKEAKKYGDVLYVIVARDSMVRHKPKPVIPEDQRLEMVSALKPVDFALLGSDSDIFEPVEKIKPDVIVLGYDQKFSEDELGEELRKRGIDAEIVRIGKYEGCELCSTASIIEKIKRER